LCVERLVPAENHLEEHDEVPADIIEDMKDMGLFGLTVPEAYGGIGLSVSQEVLVNYELGRTATAFRSVFGTNIGIGSQGILMDGTPEQKAEYLPKVASGELIMSFALTEPDAGTDAASLKTRAVLDGDHYVLNGTKRYITNAPRAGAFTLMARTGGPGAVACRPSSCRPTLPGIKLGKTDKKMGQRGTMTCDVILENVRVPAANIIGGVPGQGFKTAMKVLDRGSPEHLGRVVRHGLAHSGRVAPLCPRAQAVRQSHRRVPADPGHAGRQPGRVAGRLGAGARRGPSFRPPSRRTCPTPMCPCASRAPSCLPPKWWAAWPTVACRSTAVRATSTNTRWNASTATPACCASTKAPRRCNKSSSAANCCVRTDPAPTHRFSP
jgi:hypothetical protein